MRRRSRLSASMLFGIPVALEKVPRNEIHGSGLRVMCQCPGTEYSKFETPAFESIRPN